MFEGIKNLFRKAGASVGMVDSLTNIVDHPKIAISNDEYLRIQKDLRYFRGNFDEIKYKNTYGKLQTRPYVSLNMMQTVAHRLASLIYNEQSVITVDGKNSDMNTFVQSVLQNNDFNKNFERYLESALALGGLAMKPYADGKNIKIAYAQAPTFYPLKANTNDISECAIATVSTRTENDKPIYYTLLEFHEWINGVYTISNELYRSEFKNKVGYRVPLKQLFPDLQEVTQYGEHDNVQGVQHKLFTYLKPAGFNNKSITSPLGISICENAITTLKQLNDAYDQFNWEVRMGQRRVAVSEALLSTYEKDDKHTEYFDSEQNVFVQFGSDQDGDLVKDLTTAIRADDYIKTLGNFIKTLEMQVGLSQGTFSFDAQGLKTATEVVSENSMTYQTRNSQLTMVERSIKELIIAICELGANTIVDGLKLYSGAIPELKDIEIDFDDGVFTDKNAQLDYWTKALSAGLTPKAVAIQRTMGVDEETALEYIQQMNDETISSTPVTDPIDGKAFKE